MGRAFWRHRSISRRSHRAAAESGHRPTARTEGSAINAPRVVRRPVASISRRSMIRTGETVFVPTGFSLIRCGINEPVTKTASPLPGFVFSEAWPFGLPASTLPASTPAEMRPATLRNVSVRMNNLTTAGSPRKPRERTPPVLFNPSLNQGGEIRIPPAILPRATQQTNLFGMSLRAPRRGLPPFRHSHSDSKDT